METRASVALTRVSRSGSALSFGVRGAGRARAALQHYLRFCLYLRVTALVLQPASRGVAVGCAVWVFASFGREGGDLTRAALNREIKLLPN